MKSMFFSSAQQYAKELSLDPNVVQSSLNLG